MDFHQLITDKTIKPKEKTEVLRQWILNNPEKLQNLIDFAIVSKDPVKATCIEAIEQVTKDKPGVASSACLKFVTKSLAEKAPRVKWESARVVGNIAHLFPDNLEEAIKNLLVNSEHSGTVVRWSAAFAVGEILKLKTNLNKDLLPKVEALCEKEEKNSIKKIYLSAMKKI